MKELLFKVSRDADWDENTFVVVVSDTTKNAYLVAKDFDSDFSEGECEIEYIGIAASNFKLGDIVCSEFQSG